MRKPASGVDLLCSHLKLGRLLVGDVLMIHSEVWISSARQPDLSRSRQADGITKKEPARRRPESLGSGLISAEKEGLMWPRGAVEESCRYRAEYAVAERFARLSAHVPQTPVTATAAITQKLDQLWQGCLAILKQSCTACSATAMGSFLEYGWPKIAVLHGGGDTKRKSGRPKKMIHISRNWTPDMGGARSKYEALYTIREGMCCGLANNA
jgi:hypothetical protein